MPKVVKAFKVDEETLLKYDQLKRNERMTSDYDFFVKLLDYAEIMQSKQLVPMSLVTEKDEKLNKIFFEIGRLQGVLKEKENVISEKEFIIDKIKQEKEEIIKQKEQLKKEKDEFEIKIKNKSLFKRILWAINSKK